MLDKLKSEPLRVRLYSGVVLVAGYLVSRGVIQPGDAEFVAALTLIVLAVEKSRERVSPVSEDPDA